VGNAGIIFELGKSFVEGALEWDQRYVGEKGLTIQIIVIKGLTTKVKPET
jgi:hypothetical protein